MPAVSKLPLRKPLRATSSTGPKQFITNGGDAEIYTIIALTDKTRGARGASAFIVEKDTPGFTFGKKEKKIGIRASSTVN